LEEGGVVFEVGVGDGVQAAVRLLCCVWVGGIDGAICVGFRFFFVFLF